MPASSPRKAILLVEAPDRIGIVAAIAEFLCSHKVNILRSDQHQDLGKKAFFARIECDLAELDLDSTGFGRAFEPIAKRFDMRWRLENGRAKPKLAVFVSRYDHCLEDVLYRYKSGEFTCEIALIISNHPDAKPLADFYRIPFHVVPVAPDAKAAAEHKQLELLRLHGVDLIALARYMQVFSGSFVAQYPSRIINVHHSFLPAFTGARPYERAMERGVKLIGATSHYVTDELDQGPIIAQDVVHVSHRDQIEDLMQKGRDLEKRVLARAIRWHVEHRILLNGNKTVIFD